MGDVTQASHSRGFEAAFETDLRNRQVSHQGFRFSKRESRGVMSSLGMSMQG